MSTEDPGKIWKEIKGKSPPCPPALGLPVLASSNFSPSQTGTSNHRQVSALATPTPAWISSEICPGKGARTIGLTSIPTVLISLENPLEKASPSSSESVHKGSNWTSYMEIKAWIIEYQSSPRDTPRPCSPVPHLIPYTAFSLTASTWTPKPPSQTDFPLIIKFRMCLAHKRPLVTLIQHLFSEHLLCTRPSASLWGFKNS